jgi:hypothetical protein
MEDLAEVSSLSRRTMLQPVFVRLQNDICLLRIPLPAELRIPRDGGHDSTLMADSVPPSWRTPFHGDGGQHSILMADT